jgi:cytochrome c553
MWDEEDGFYYDVLRLPDGRATRLKVRSMVGLLPLCAATVFEPKLRQKYPVIDRRFRRFLDARPELCAACHGLDAKGNPQLGAPNLADGIWLHGGSLASIRETIEKGRSGAMPAHAVRLGETRVKLLAAYVLSLGRQQPDVVASVDAGEHASP